MKKLKAGLKILGNGELTRKISVKAHLFSKSALDKIQKAGGSRGSDRANPQPAKPAEAK